MKKYLSALMAGLFLLAFTACDDDDNHHHQPNRAITKAFEAKFPHASQTTWLEKHAYAVAEFHQDGYETDAWFDQTGKLYMIKTEYESLDRIPDTVVRDSFNNSLYGQWKVEDVDYLKRLNMEGVYIIEVERGEEEFDLVFSTTGALIKVVPDDNDDYYEDFVPNEMIQTAIGLVKVKYPDAQIVEAEIEDGNIEIEIVTGHLKKEIVYNRNHVWMYTKYDVRKSDVEAGVLATIAKEYASYRIDDIEKYEMPAPHASYYEFELELGDQEIKVKIGLDGIILR